MKRKEERGVEVVEGEEKDNVALKHGGVRKRGGDADRWQQKDSSLWKDLAKLREKD